jgi:hypothetical protein
MHIVGMLIDKINDDIGREQWHMDYDGDNWIVLYNDGEEVTQGYKEQIIPRLKQIAHENGVYL